MQIDVVDDLKQPEYTGENRCEPCTVLNLAIAAVVGSLVARKSRLGGLLAIAVSVALIYLRGYLVPGTPTLTKRYLPPEVLRWFGKEPDPAVASGLGAAGSTGTTPADASRSGSESTDTSSASGDVATFDESDDIATPDDDSIDGEDDRAIVDLETFFLDHDVLEPCSDRDDLCLTAEFETAWFDEIEPLDESGVDAAAAVDAFGFEADPDEFELETRDETHILLAGGRGAGRWPSRAGLIADVAASRALETWIDDWDAYDPETKGEVLNSLRMFLETCPSGGDVEMGEEVVESCCTSHQVVAVTCEETGERLFEQRLSDVEA
ncbi:hypothetical protein [Natrinema salsiterrestre]|uniref:Uncharacterized protein n=1 Tax=Natrinema salsiterrestre TaxID=2950540 RepID=A0A9Q4L729_9EURY|nr:hypothetical protein [Natrinema salsiterrestre]MDF9747762.1 hypothetical protein [Natrinema salsiterrestre]